MANYTPQQRALSIFVGQGVLAQQAAQARNASQASNATQASQGSQYAMPRPASLLDVQRITQNVGLFNSPRVPPTPFGQQREVGSSVGRLPYCCGPTVGFLNQDDCSTMIETVIPPYCPLPEDICFDKDDRKQTEIARRAMTYALQGAPVITTQRSFQEHPGWRGQRMPQTPPTGAVFVCGGSAPSVAAANAMRNAWIAGEALIPLAVVNLGNSGGGVELFHFTIPDTKSYVGDSLMIGASAVSAFADLQFSVEVSGYQAVPLFNAVPGDAWPINLTALQGETVTVKAGCLDPNCSYQLLIRIDGWSKAVERSDDSLASTTARYNPGWVRQ
jgi:hypothetical protein